MTHIIDNIRNGEYPSDKPLPSLNSMALATGLSKETVIKAYSHLCKEGVINSKAGKGYFVREGFLSGRPSVIVILDKFSPHQQSVMDGIAEVLKERADITVLMHYQNLAIFESELTRVVDKHDWYLVFPHFSIDPASQKKAINLLKTIPEEKLIIIDRLIDGIPEKAGASYQAIETDIPSTLSNYLEAIKKYRKLRYFSLSVSLYGDIVAETIKSFCNDNSVEVEILGDVPETIEENDLFFVSGSRLDKRLSELIKKISAHGFTTGKEVGLICFNDFPLNEFILGGLTTLSTDFVQMGRTAAEMVLSGRLSKILCPFTLIRRNTF